MGIKHLNHYIKRNCNKGIEYITIETLRGKVIVVDTSIYMYKYLEEDLLLENFFVLITKFREYNITPLFIFDGKAHSSKMELLWNRVLKKRNALKEFEKIKLRLENENFSSDDMERKNLKRKMETCKKYATRIKDTDIVALKGLFDALGVYYFVAEMEADIVCAYFVKKNIAWACMSDDMDMFVYGCKFVLREWNLHKSSGILYDRDQIMRELWVEPQYFSLVLLLLGSDYHQEICKKEHPSIATAFIWYDEFMKINTSNKLGFYDWLKGTNKISVENANKLETIYNMFVVPEHMEIKDVVFKNRSINWMELRKLLAPYGFVM